MTCAVGARRFAGRYREFLLDPNTLFTLASLLLLIAAGVVNPGGVLSGGEVSQLGIPLYLASALVGSVYISGGSPCRASASASSPRIS